MWARIINTICGLWLMVAPSVLTVPQHAVHIFYILGPLIASVAIISMSESVRNFRLFNLLPGTCLVMFPLFQEGPVAVKAHHMLIGLIIILAALQKGRITNRFGGGWKSLFQREPAHMRREV